MLGSEHPHGRCSEVEFGSDGPFVEASEDIRFEGKNRDQVYGWVEQVLVEREYARQGKSERGLVRRYVEKMTGMSRSQVTRLIARYTATGRIRPTIYRRRRFAERYTRADIELLASVDEAHETLSGPATRRILEREHPPQDLDQRLNVLDGQRLCRTERWLLGAILCVHFMEGNECISGTAVLVFGRPVDQQRFSVRKAGRPTHAVDEMRNLSGARGV